MLFLDERAPPNRWTCLLVGGLGGTVAGILAGPISMLAYVWLYHALGGRETFLGLELIGAPVIGGMFGALEGMALGAIWAFISARPRQLTIGWLMIAVAISGPMLAIILAIPSPWLVLLSLTVAVILVPPAIGDGFARKKEQEEKKTLGRNGGHRVTDRTNSRPTRPQHNDEGLSHLGVRFSDWGDPTLRDLRVSRPRRDP
jgi:hypothetical protein